MQKIKRKFELSAYTLALYMQINSKYMQEGRWPPYGWRFWAPHRDRRRRSTLTTPRPRCSMSRSSTGSRSEPGGQGRMLWRSCRSWYWGC